MILTPPQAVPNTYWDEKQINSTNAQTWFGKYLRCWELTLVPSEELYFVLSCFEHTLGTYKSVHLFNYLYAVIIITLISPYLEHRNSPTFSITDF